MAELAETKLIIVDRQRDKSYYTKLKSDVDKQGKDEFVFSTHA